MERVTGVDIPTPVRSSTILSNVCFLVYRKSRFPDTALIVQVPLPNQLGLHYVRAYIVILSVSLIPSLPSAIGVAILYSQL